MNAASYRSFLAPILLSKLPEDIKLVVSRQIEGGNWKLDMSVEILKIEVEARERCTFMNVSNPVESQSQDQLLHPQNFFRTAESLRQEESIKRRQVLYLRVPMPRNPLRMVYFVNRAIILQIAK